MVGKLDESEMWRIKNFKVGRGRGRERGSRAGSVPSAEPHGEPETGLDPMPLRS